MLYRREFVDCVDKGFSSHVSVDSYRFVRSNMGVDRETNHFWFLYTDVCLVTEINVGLLTTLLPVCYRTYRVRTDIPTYVNFRAEKASSRLQNFLGERRKKNQMKTQNYRCSFHCLPKVGWSPSTVNSHIKKVLKTQTPQKKKNHMVLLSWPSGWNRFHNCPPRYPFTFAVSCPLIHPCFTLAHNHKQQMS